VVLGSPDAEVAAMDAEVAAMDAEVAAMDAEVAAAGAEVLGELTDVLEAGEGNSPRFAWPTEAVAVCVQERVFRRDRSGETNRGPARTVDAGVTFTVLTLFREIVDAYFANSIMAKAISRMRVSCRSIIHPRLRAGQAPQVRRRAVRRRRGVADAERAPRPRPGGARGPSPGSKGSEAARPRRMMPRTGKSPRPRVVFLSPSGRPFDRAWPWIRRSGILVLLCGRYEGIDQRIIVPTTDEVSIGDYVLSSGEVAAWP
jgi:hypothetical protein